MKEILVPAGERRRVLRRLSSSIPQRFVFDIEPTDPSHSVSGTVEVRGSRWLFPKPPVVADLQPSFTVEKGFWDTIFSVWIRPDQDVRVVLRDVGLL